MRPDLIRRQAATQATMNRYAKKKFDWRKRATCIHMVQFHLRQMGHTPPAVPDIRSLLGAARALKERGCTNVGEMIDTLLPSIPPAAMLLGDVAMLRDESGIGALVVNVGGKVMGWHDDAERMVVMDALQIERAWRV